jgi:hypothetical protein
MKYGWILVLLALVSIPAAGLAQPGPGPENGGLQLRFVLSPVSAADKEGVEARLDLINTTKRDITLLAGWQYEESKGDMKEYIKAAASIETYPAIAPWSAQVRGGNRKAPQPEYVLKAGEVFTVKWTTDGRRLKNKVADPIHVPNPEFPFPGMYSVHATLKIYTADETVLLRSNEQLAAIGGSREFPKHTYGQLEGVDEETRIATLNLGASHKIEPGDEFQIRIGLTDLWKLTISQVGPDSSTGHLAPWPRVGQDSTNSNMKFPERYMNAALISKE